MKRKKKKRQKNTAEIISTIFTDVYLYCILLYAIVYYANGMPEMNCMHCTVEYMPIFGNGFDFQNRDKNYVHK